MLIYCPKCGWQPAPESRWWCTCGHSWNTFDTRALCPECGKQWKDTQCLKCDQFSPHDDWYHEKDPKTRVREKPKVREQVNA